MALARDWATAATAETLEEGWADSAKAEALAGVLDSPGDVENEAERVTEVPAAASTLANTELATMWAPRPVLKGK